MMSVSTTPSSPPPGLVYIAAVTPSVNLLVIGTACASTLIPIAVILVLFSNAHSRRRPLFYLNVSIIILGIVLGTVNIHIQTRFMQGIHVQPELSTTYAILTVLTPALADCVLSIRVITVYPPCSLSPSRRLCIYGPLVMIKIARLVIDLIFIVHWTRTVFLHAENPFHAGQEAWATPFPKLAWSLQLFDSTYASVLFLLRLSKGWLNSNRFHEGAGRAQNISAGTENTATSYYDRIRTLFWISASNFVFPVLLNLAQLILAFHDPSFLDGAYILVVNNYVSIIGVLFATIWSTGTKSSPMPTLGDNFEMEMGGGPVQSPRFAPASEPEDQSDEIVTNSSPATSISS